MDSTNLEIHDGRVIDTSFGRHFFAALEQGCIALLLQLLDFRIDFRRRSTGRRGLVHLGPFALRNRKANLSRQRDGRISEGCVYAARLETKLEWVRIELEVESVTRVLLSNSCWPLWPMRT